MKKQTIIMDLSGIYREESFFENREEVCWLDCRDISGVNGYCSDDAQEEIRKRIQEYSYEGIHFLDSGNYHYLSKFWLEKVQQPFSLIVFDHHTDMQESAFFGLLSCGSWVKEVLETNPYVKEVCVVGPPKESVEQCEPELASRVVFVTQEELQEGKLEQWEAFLEGRKELPVYLSIDKDVLCMEDARTNWDQGEMKLVELEEMIKQVFQNRNLLGADICGENPQDTAKVLENEGLEINSNNNLKLYHLLLKNKKRIK